MYDLKAYNRYIFIFLLMVCTVLVQYTLLAGGKKVFDPVCERKVDKDDERTIQGEYEGKIYYFCSVECFNKFKAFPDDYACPCPPGGRDCSHCRGETARCPCIVAQHPEEHKGHRH